MYKLLVYVGVYQLQEEGIYDTFDEASDRLFELYNEENEDEKEIFIALSRIEEVK